MKLVQSITDESQFVQGTRVAALVGGTALLIYGLRARTRGGIGLAFLGGNMLYYAATGKPDLRTMLGRPAEQWPEGNTIRYGQGIRVDKAVTIRRTPEDLYRFWRDLENLPRFMRHLKSVEARDSISSHWVAEGPAGLLVSWDAEIIHDEENRRIGWRSLPGADVPNAGSVQFERLPDEAGTLVRVELKYDPPAGPIGAAFAQLLGRDPGQEVLENLVQLKNWMEGEPVQESR